LIKKLENPSLRQDLRGEQPMKQRNRILDYRTLGFAAAVTLASGAITAAQQPTQAPVKVGIVTFLTGPAAAPFGIPGRNAAEILIESLNAGSLPAPYNRVGLGGAKIEAKFVDEAGSTAQQVTEFRNLVQRDKVDVVVGYVSSGNCLAVAPVAEAKGAHRHRRLRYAAPVRGEAAQIRLPREPACDHG
jgi:Periplasmic binding protein